MAKQAGRVVVDPDFRIACGFFGHPKTKKLRRALGYVGIFGLQKLWAWATTNRSDGNLAGLSDEDLEDAVDWLEMGGQPGTLLPALEAIRWVDGAEGARVLHDWLENNPYVATKHVRVERARKGAAARWGQGELPLDPAAPPDGPPEDASSIPNDAPSIPASTATDAPSNAPCLTPPYLPNQSESPARAPEAAPESEAQSAALALVAAGCPDASAFDPVLRAAIVEIPAQALVDLSKKHPGKPLNYLVSAFRGRKADAAKTGNVAGSGLHSVVTSAGPVPSQPRETESQETAAKKARAHWIECGMSADEADRLLAVKGPPQLQGATP